MGEPAAATEPLRKTPLHDVHVKLGAVMGPFAGWEMPIHYPDGILAEHKAVRRSGGIFDVSHMGRFYIEGTDSKGNDAGAFLAASLTHETARVRIGTAQYNLIPMPDGGTVDDCYLYRLDEDDWLLVVNAANRAKDWDHLEAIRAKGFPGVRMTDRTEAIAMPALQGPESEAALVDGMKRLGLPTDLPRRGRNRLRSVRHPDGWELLVARTGYTGEPVCFELFVDAGRAEALWNAILEAGNGRIVPAGLGSRNTLRSEAGLPLYGDELSAEISGLVAGLHQLAIRTIDTEEEYEGRRALLDAYLARPDRRVIPFAIEGRGRSPREGDLCYQDGKEIGTVTSATTIPYETEDGIEGLRRIGFALLPSSLRLGFRRGNDRRFGDRIEIRRAKGNGESTIAEAELVDRFVRLSDDRRRLLPVLYGDPPDPATPEVYAAKAKDLTARANANHDWRQTRCINLIPSENTPSAFVREMCELDPSGRYAEHNRAGLDEVYFYQGTDWIREVEERLKTELRAIFGCLNVEPRPISGQMANETVFEALVRFSTFKNRKSSRAIRRLGRVFHHHLALGGHLSSQPSGALYNYVEVGEDGTPCTTPFPVRPDHPYAIDIEKTVDLIEKEKPELLILGKSMILDPEPVAELRRAIDTFHPEERPLIMYDMAHVLGLYGPDFQEPLAEGADVVTGSTHKTFPGPQRGVVLANLDEAFGRGRFLWRHIERAAFPGATSNHHLGTLQGLLAAAYEFRAFGREYQRGVMENARAFAKALADAGLAVEGDPAAGYTRTHQVLLRVGDGKGIETARRLEANNVIVNFQGLPGDESFHRSSGIRMGTQEMTRFGMGPDDFGELAGLMADCILRGKAVGDAVAHLRARFTRMRYCFEEGSSLQNTF